MILVSVNHLVPDNFDGIRGNIGIHTTFGISLILQISVLVSGNATNNIGMNLEYRYLVSVLV